MFSEPVPGGSAARSRSVDERGGRGNVVKNEERTRWERDGRMCPVQRSDVQPVMVGPVAPVLRGWASAVLSVFIV